MPPGHLWRPLLAKDVRPVCFRIVSRFRQNGFIRPDFGLFFAKIRDVDHIQVDRPATERAAGTWAGINTIIKTKGIGWWRADRISSPAEYRPESTAPPRRTAGPRAWTSPRRQQRIAHGLGAKIVLQC